MQHPIACQRINDPEISRGKSERNRLRRSSAASRLWRPPGRIRSPSEHLLVDHRALVRLADGGSRSVTAPATTAATSSRKSRRCRPRQRRHQPSAGGRRAPRQLLLPLDPTQIGVQRDDFVASRADVRERSKSAIPDVVVEQDGRRKGLRSVCVQLQFPQKPEPRFFHVRYRKLGFVANPGGTLRIISAGYKVSQPASELRAGHAPAEESAAKHNQATSSRHRLPPHFLPSASAIAFSASGAITR